MCRFIAAKDASDTDLQLVMEYMAGGSLDKAISKGLSQPRKLQVCMQVAAGLDYMHTLKTPLVHLDLKR